MAKHPPQPPQGYPPQGYQQPPAGYYQQPPPQAHYSAPRRKQGRGCLGTLVTGAVVTFGMLVVLGMLVNRNAPNSPVTTADKPKAKATPAAEPTPVAAPDPAPAATPPPAPAAPRPTIKGLAPVDVYGPLVDRGFTRKGPTPWGDDVMYSAKQDVARDATAGIPSKWYSVEMFGPSATSVRRINAMAVAIPRVPSAEALAHAREFLGFVATVQYEGSQPAQARKWVEAAVGKAGKLTATFGGVTYEYERTNANAYWLAVYVPE